MSHPTTHAANGEARPDLRATSQGIDGLLMAAQRLDASSLHLKVGCPPSARVHGAFRPLDGPPLRREDMERLVSLLSPRHQMALAEDGAAELSHFAPDGCRFHLSVFRQRGDLALVARRIGNVVPTLEGLGLPEAVAKLCDTPAGLIVVAGSAGSGRRTTIAAMLDHINARRPAHILTVEEHIRLDIADKRACVHQREAGSDYRDRHKALDDAIRQGSDVLFVGVVTDADVAGAALRAAVGGRLVFAAVTAPDAPSAIRQILAHFPPEGRPAVRKALANHLKGVIAQMLMKGLKKPLVLASEVMLVNPTIKKLIEASEDRKLPDAIRIFYQEGMVDFTEDLKRLTDGGHIDKATALDHAPAPEKLKMAFKGIKVAASGLVGPAEPPPPSAAPVQTPTASPAAPPTVRRQATVRYFTRMYPAQLYRLLVVLSEQEVRKLAEAEVGQAAGKDFRARLQEPVEIEPMLPGCSVYPPRQEVTLSRDGPTEARFQVLAHVQGGGIEGACVVIRQAGRELARVALAVNVGKPTLAYALACASVAVPALLKYLKLDLDAQMGAGFSGYWHAVDAVLSLPWWLWTAPLLAAAGVALWWCWPREDVFWGVELVPPEKGGPG